MTINRQIGYGMTLSYDPGTGTYVSLGSIMTPPSGPNAKTEKADVTLLTDKFKQYQGAQVDPGEVTFTILYDAADATTTAVAGLLASSAVVPWKIGFPTGTPAYETTHGFVAAVDRKTATADGIKGDITIQISGDPGFTA